MTRKEKIQAVIDDMSDEDLIEIHNKYCKEVDWLEDYVYPMSEFDSQMWYKTPIEIAFAIRYGSFNPRHQYFCFNGYGNLESFDKMSDFNRLDTSEIAEYIDENGNSFGYDPIEDILIWEEK